MLEQLSNNLTCVVQFTTANAGATGLTVTVDVWRVTNGAATSLVTSQSASEIGKGCYRYSLASTNTGTEGLYLFIFSTAGTADLKDIAAGWAVSTAGVEHLDADTSSRLAPTVAGRTLDVSTGGEAGLDLANVGSPTTTVNLSGTTIAAVSGAVGSVTGAVGSVTGAVGSVTGNVGGSVASVTGAVGSVTGNVGGNVTGSVASVTGNVGGNVVGSVASVVAGVTLAASAVTAIWDKLTSALTTAGSIGKLLVDNIDAAISSRLASGSYTAPDNASITAIKAKTDNLPSDPADASDIAASFSTVNATLATIAGYIDTEVAAIKAKTDQLTFTLAGKVDASIQAAGDFAQAAADKVWSTTTRSLTTFGTLVADTATAVWSAVTRTLTSFGSLQADVTAIKAKTDTITGGSITVTSPLNVITRLLTVMHGDSLTVTVSSDAWNSLVAAKEVRATVRGRVSDAIIFTMTDNSSARVVGSGTQSVQITISATNSLLLTPGTRTAKWDIQAILANDDVKTLVAGFVTVVDDQTRTITVVP